MYRNIKYIGGCLGYGCQVRVCLLISVNTHLGIMKCWKINYGDDCTTTIILKVIQLYTVGELYVTFIIQEKSCIEENGVWLIPAKMVVEKEDFFSLEK